MDSEAKIYLERADSKILLAKTVFDISMSRQLKGILGITQDKTFFSDVISMAYYGIFYAAKAYLLSERIKTSPPEEHKKTYDEFKKFVASGRIGRQLLDIYDEETQKAEALLKIFHDERRKRGIFTYNVKSEANIPAARESIDNARDFISAVKLVMGQNGHFIKNRLQKK